MFVLGSKLHHYLKILSGLLVQDYKGLAVIVQELLLAVFSQYDDCCYESFCLQVESTCRINKKNMLVND